SGGGGSEGGTPPGLQAIDQPGGQRGFGTDHDQVDAVGDGGVDQAVQIGRRDGKIPGELGGPGIAGRREDGRGGVVLVQLPREGMLPAPPADDQDPHFFFIASENAWAARFAESTTSFTTAFASFM